MAAMTGDFILTELLTLARAQTAALAANELDEFRRLADLREPLVTTLGSAVWLDRSAAQTAGRELMARDQDNERTLRRMLAETARARSALTRGNRALHAYGSPAEVRRATTSHFDRSA